MIVEAYKEIEMTKREKNLLNHYNIDTINKERFVIENPKICITNYNAVKKIQICPNADIWAITVYRSKRKKNITDNEAHCKTLKYLRILNGLDSL